MASSRIHTTLDQQLTTSSGAPKTRVSQSTVRADRVLPTDVTDPVKLAQILNTVLRELDVVSRATPGARVTFRNVSVDSSNTANIFLTHSLGAEVSWKVVGWRGLSNGFAFNLHDDKADAVTLTTLDRLVLRSGVAGTVDIEVEALP